MDDHHYQSFERNGKKYTVDEGDFKESLAGKNFSESYKIGDFIANGDNSIVYKGINTQTNEAVAIKISNFNPELDKELPNEVIVHQKAIEAVKNTRYTKSNLD